jgi:hypothetical protein
MKRTSLLLALCAAWLVVWAPAADAQPYRLSLTLNPFSWIAGFYGFEATVPLGRAVELGGQAAMFNEAFFESTYGSEVEVTGERPLYYPLRAGAVLRLFPFEDLAGGFLTGRAMYVQVPGRTEEANARGEVSLGVDIGYRQMWPAGRGWGWMSHVYAGFDRIVTGNEAAPPVLPVLGLRAGLYF